MKRIVYADNSATTRVSKRALEAMLPYFRELYGNPSAIYSAGMKTARAVLAARQKIAGAIGAQKVSEIYFTSGGSEADSWAIKGAAELGTARGKRHIVTTAFEHHAVLNTCKYLEKHGFEVTYLPVSEDGFVSVESAEKAMREDTCLVSVMTANNEVGTIQPVAEIGRLCRQKGILMHTDAVAAVGSIEVDVEKLNADMLSISGHKLHAPKGIGVLYCRYGVELPGLIHGGSQERGKRAGTENVPAIVALGEAAEEACENIREKQRRVESMRNRLISGLLEIGGSALNGSTENRLAGNANISFEGAQGEGMVLMLDIEGISASSGAACSSGSVGASHVLMAMGRDKSQAASSLRLSINEENNDEDIDYMLEKIPLVVEKLRRLK